MINYARAALLLSVLTAIFMALGYMVAGQQGMMIALIAALVMNGSAYWFSDRILLRMQRAELVDSRAAPELYQRISQLAAKAGIPTPKIYLVDSQQPNAFATGRNPQNAAVAVTTGLLKYLKPEEVSGVLAHELAHIRHRDTLIMTIAATIAGAIGLMTQFAFLFGSQRRNNQSSSNPIGMIGGLLLLILAPLAAMLIQMAISRSREYQADAGGAEISGNPLALASALEKIHQLAGVKENPYAQANPATAHLYIINPLHAGNMAEWFSTHPPIEKRIERLQQMASRLSPSRQEILYKGPWG